MGLRRKRARGARPPAPPPGQTAERARSKPAAGSRKRGSGSPLRRLVYWCAGARAVGGDRRRRHHCLSPSRHLPPIQSLEVPKRPPTVEIVGTDGAPLATRGEMSGADGPAQGAAGLSAEGLRRDRGPPLLQPLSASTRSGCARALSPTSCTAACRRAARPSRSNSPRTCF